MDSEKMRTESYEHSLEALQGDVKTVLRELALIKTSVGNLESKEDAGLLNISSLTAANASEKQELAQLKHMGLRGSVTGMRGPWAAGLQGGAIDPPRGSRRSIARR